jgi:hypothetical protein
MDELGLFIACGQQATIEQMKADIAALLGVRT